MAGSASESRWVRLHVVTWGLFALLVLLRVHGSSIGVLPTLDDQRIGAGDPMAYLMARPLAALRHGDPSPPSARTARWLGMQPQGIRSDEWSVSTLWSMAQFAHAPRFPVINRNIGQGQIMLLGPSTPVLHLTALARPVTWGYLLLGLDRGLAWCWWFPFFACFTTLALLLDHLLGRGQARGLALLGALWFVGSAYVVGWSGWPAYQTFFISLICLCTHRILTTARPRNTLLPAALLSLAVPAFATCTYPAWQVPLTWLCLALLGGLLVRDRAWATWTTTWRWRFGALAGAALLAGVLLASYVHATLPALRALMGTVYPGSRFHAGGGYPFSWLLRGYYNLWTFNDWFTAFGNSSEAGSFFYLFPAVGFAWLVWPGLRQRMGLFGWILICALVALLIYMFVGYPRLLAAVTLMGRCHPPRADLPLGICSILLCCLALRHSAPLPANPATPDDARRAIWVPRAAALFMLLLMALHAFAVRAEIPQIADVRGLVALLCLAVALLSHALLRGQVRAVAAALVVSLFFTCFPFNPLARGTGSVQDTELVRAVAQIERDTAAAAAPSGSPGRPLWLCYGRIALPSVCGSLIAIAGGHSLTAVHQYPQLDLWRRFDPDRAQENAYNRYAHVELRLPTGEKPVEFIGSGSSFGGPDAPAPDVLAVRIAPGHPVLRQLGARFVVVLGDDQDDMEFWGMTRRYQAESRKFSIFELPAP